MNGWFWLGIVALMLGSPGWASAFFIICVLTQPE